MCNDTLCYINKWNNLQLYTSLLTRVIKKGQVIDNKEGREMALLACDGVSNC